MKILHFVNPNTAQWRDIAASVIHQLSGRVHLISFQEWLAAIEAADESDGAGDIPAAKLSDFLHEIGREDAVRPVFSTTATTTEYPELAKMPAVSVEWMERRMRQWVLSSNPDSKL